MRSLAVVALLTISLSSLAAHPHVWIDSRTEVYFDADRLDRLVHHWTFDELFSQSVLLDYDTNRNQRIEEAERRQIEANAFSNLRYYDYFTHLVLGGREVQVSEVEDFDARVEGTRLVYTFTIPLDLAVERGWQRIAVGVWDATYFVEVSYASPAVAVYGAREAGVEIDLALRENPAEAYWGGIITPREIRLAYRRAR
ncbi:MAG: DUF1007 family protein [Spirochaetaceae bacterium]